jgi:hypothetical protein
VFPTDVGMNRPLRRIGTGGICVPHRRGDEPIVAPRAGAWIETILEALIYIPDRKTRSAGKRRPVTVSRQVAMIKGRVKTRWIDGGKRI